MNKPENLIEMGYVATAFGIQGWVKIKCTTEYEDSLNDYEVVYLRHPNKKLETKKIENSFVRDKIFHAKFDGINNRDAAFALRGATVCVDRNDFPEPLEDEFYWVDLIGLLVVNQQNEQLGVVKDLMATGANDVLVVLNEDKTERLIPFVAAHVLNVDLPNKQITVDWGLDY
ncbi:MAG: ribosome maturation factor RimM [Burkholderiales bacterium]|nr:ribosome maturation factor RimM [Burkholderiales bacterium]